MRSAVATLLATAIVAAQAARLAPDQLPCSPKDGRNAQIGSAVKGSDGRLTYVEGAHPGDRRARPRMLVDASTSSRLRAPSAAPTVATHLTPTPQTPPAHADALAHGVYVDSGVTASNFGKLRIRTLPTAPDAEQAHAAGWLEGYMTAARMHDHW
jgi:hypothetical protein